MKRSLATVMSSQNQTMKMNIVRLSTTKFLKVKPSCKKNIEVLPVLYDPAKLPTHERIRSKRENPNH